MQVKKFNMTQNEEASTICHSLTAAFVIVICTLMVIGPSILFLIHSHQYSCSGFPSQLNYLTGKDGYFLLTSSWLPSLTNR